MPQARVGRVGALHRHPFLVGLVGLSLFVSGVLLDWTLPASAKTLTVTNCNYSGPGSLRQEVADSSSGDTITFSLTGCDVIDTYQASSSSPIELSHNITIAGPGLSALTILGPNSVASDFLIDAGVTASISGLTVFGGGDSLGASGGGVINDGTLTLSDVELAGNDNSGVLNSGALTITESQVSGNNGSGILNGGSLLVDDSTFAGNVALGGAGVLNTGTATITRSAFLANIEGLCPLSSGCHFLGGGAALNSLGTMSISNSTFFENEGEGNTLGGAIDNQASLSLANDTFANNWGQTVYSGPSASTILSATIIARTNGGNDCGGSPPVDAGYNLDDDGSCALSVALGDLSDTNPDLDISAQDNAGPTTTVALLGGSPAIDHVAAPDCPATDQRGLPRVSPCDIGAYDTDGNDTDLVLSTPNDITAPATGTTGATVTYSLPVVTDEDGTLPPPTCEPPSGSLFPVGTTTVTCSVTDSDDAYSTVSTQFTVTVTPPTATTLLQQLAAAVTGLPPGLSLSAKVTAAEAYYAANNIPDTCSVLGAFVNEVAAQTGKKLTVSQALALTTQAQGVETTLSCPSTDPPHSGGPGFTSGTTVSAPAGTAFSFDVTTTGSPGPKLKLRGKLPKGIRFQDRHNGSAVLTGTPKSTRHRSAVGRYPLTITATFGKGKAKVVMTQALTLTIAP